MRKKKHPGPPAKANRSIAPNRAVGDLLLAARNLEAAGDLASALGMCRNALSIAPLDVDANLLYAFVAYRLGKLDEALPRLLQARDLQPDTIGCYYGLHDVLQALRRSSEAIDVVMEGCRRFPAETRMVFLLDESLRNADRQSESIPYLRQLFQRTGEQDFNVALRLRRAEDATFEWTLGAEERKFEPDLANIEQSEILYSLGIIDDPARLLELHQAYARRSNFTKRQDAYSFYPTFGRKDKIRIGYVSNEFHEHAVARLVVEHLEQHDRDRFEVFGYTFGPDDGSEMLRRIRRSFDHLRYVYAFPAATVAQKIYADQIDVLVDLKGYTTAARTGIFAYRPAPIQVNWLGYPGTLGSDAFDYILADKTIIPEDLKACYSEEVLWHPSCYQSNDSQRKLLPPPERSAVGLPAAEIVFCSFNQSFKIQRRQVVAWANIMGRVPGSVLWIMLNDPVARKNLLAYFESRGIGEERIVFAQRASQENHLARLQCADIMLDTYPYNAHTTSSDALWAGVPVVTQRGTAFASRVATSLLTAVGLDELSAPSADRYEEIAVELALDRTRLDNMKRHLVANRNRLPLFDTPKFTKSFETMFVEMVRARQAR
jgi:predicted O-linked N-acetylglucosamine transferase (SPINDLY family)